ncbi:hypothetical protein ACFW9V_36235, partial [Streptomyces hygroscopicus]
GGGGGGARRPASSPPLHRGWGAGPRGPPGGGGAGAADVAGDRANATSTASDAGPAVTVEGMPACVAKQVTRPVRKREAPAAEQPLA